MLASCSCLLLWLFALGGDFFLHHADAVQTVPGVGTVPGVDRAHLSNLEWTEELRIALAETRSPLLEKQWASDLFHALPGEVVCPVGPLSTPRNEDQDHDSEEARASTPEEQEAEASNRRGSSDDAGLTAEQRDAEEAAAEALRSLSATQVFDRWLVKPRGPTYCKLCAQAMQLLDKTLFAANHGTAYAAYLGAYISLAVADNHFALRANSGLGQLLATSGAGNKNTNSGLDRNSNSVGRIVRIAAPLMGNILVSVFCKAVQYFGLAYVKALLAPQLQQIARRMVTAPGGLVGQIAAAEREKQLVGESRRRWEFLRQSQSAGASSAQGAQDHGTQQVAAASSSALSGTTTLHHHHAPNPSTMETIPVQPSAEFQFPRQLEKKALEKVMPFVVSGENAFVTLLLQDAPGLLSCVLSLTAVIAQSVKTAKTKAAVLPLFVGFVQLWINLFGPLEARLNTATEQYTEAARRAWAANGVFNRLESLQAAVLDNPGSVGVEVERASGKAAAELRAEELRISILHILKGEVQGRTLGYFMVPLSFFASALAGVPPEKMMDMFLSGQVLSALMMEMGGKMEAVQKTKREPDFQQWLRLFSEQPKFDFADAELVWRPLIRMGGRNVQVASSVGVQLRHVNMLDAVAVEGEDAIASAGVRETGVNATEEESSASGVLAGRSRTSSSASTASSSLASPSTSASSTSSSDPENEDARFLWPENRFVRGQSLDIVAGSWTHINAEFSGEGKSTLAKDVVARWWEPDAGSRSWLLDGQTLDLGSTSSGINSAPLTAQRGGDHRTSFGLGAVLGPENDRGLAMARLAKHIVVVNRKLELVGETIREQLLGSPVSTTLSPAGSGRLDRYPLPDSEVRSAAELTHIWPKLVELYRAKHPEASSREDNDNDIDLSALLSMKLQKSDFSDGQEARYRLAWALLRRPRVLVLDEVTKDLDKPTEIEVVRNLRYGAGARRW
eukprot:g17658.t1